MYAVMIELSAWVQSHDFILVYKSYSHAFSSFEFVYSFKDEEENETGIWT